MNDHRHRWPLDVRLLVALQRATLRLAAWLETLWEPRWIAAVRADLRRRRDDEDPYDAWRGDDPGLTRLAYWWPKQDDDDHAR